LEPLALTAKSAGLGLLLATALLAIEREGLVLLRELLVLLRELLVSEMELPAFVKEKLVFVTALLATVLVREFGRVGRKHRSTPVVPQGGIPSVAPALTYSFQDSKRV